MQISDGAKDVGEEAAKEHPPPLEGGDFFDVFPGYARVEDGEEGEDADDVADAHDVADGVGVPVCVCVYVCRCEYFMKSRMMCVYVCLC